jgi:metal-responsive CopG/Arc/MetJ family transcriptional regulator
MPIQKTVISLGKSLLERVDALARELDIPRDRIFVLAVEELLQRHQNRQLLKGIDRTCEAILDREEELYRARMRQRHRGSVEGQW